MTVDPQANPDKRFASLFLPWIVAAGALCVYLLTLNHWVSFGNLTAVAKLSGWTWQPELHGPVYWLLTLPLRWLPARLIPLGINLFSLLCAVATLGLLARSVLLLPQDRTQEQRRRLGDTATVLSLPTAWLPPLLAVLACGLQLTFWESATSATSQALTGGSNEMLDLLLFAYVVRCLLEYRSDWRESWLLRAAFVYGAGMTNNWAMVGFFPLLVVALIWIKGLSFFNLRFLLRMFFCGFAALLLYLLLPVVQGWGSDVQFPFWTALKANLGAQKSILAMLFNFGRQNLLLLSLTSLVPILIISIRWSSYFGDTSELGVAFATFAFHAVHALFFAACLWVTLDPQFSPRNKGWGIPFLTFYYLGALSIGYFSAYFMIVFGDKRSTNRRGGSEYKLLHGAANIAVWVLLFLVPATLLYRNLPQIRITNGPLLAQYCELLTRNLAPGSVVLSDDDRRLWLAQSYAIRKGTLKSEIFINTDSFKWPDYNRHLQRVYGARWPKMTLPTEMKAQIAATELVAGVAMLMSSNAVYYLHPSFGYYFEYFQPEPHGMVYKLVTYPAGALLRTKLTPQLLTENDRFWSDADTLTLNRLEAIVAVDSPRKLNIADALLKKAHLPQQQNGLAQALGSYYSQALDYWAVELQRNGKLTNAATFFERALDLNPGNIVAQVNLQCNKNLQAGRVGNVQLSKSIEDEFGEKYRSWDAVINANGPFDEPNFCFEQGRVFVRNNLIRQAAQQIDRAREMTPNFLDPYLWLAQLHVLNRTPSEALKIVDTIRATPALAVAAETNRAQLLFVETSARLTQGNLSAADAVVRSYLDKSPGDDALLSTAGQVFMNYGCYTNALDIFNQQLRATPNNLTLLNNKGFVLMTMKRYDEAIPPLESVLKVDTNNYSARLNRAISYLRLKKFDEAMSDYEILQKAHPTDPRVAYGLAEIAWNRKDNPAAIRYYELYLSNANTNTAEGKIVIERLKTLKSGSS
jgi:tetratricopeptide (TPR) repeat protein